MADGYADGEAVDVTMRKRRRLSDPEIARVRRQWMARMRDAGSPIEEIGAMFRCSERHVFRELALLETDNDGSVRRTA